LGEKKHLDDDLAPQIFALCFANMNDDEHTGKPTKQNRPSLKQSRKRRGASDSGRSQFLRGEPQVGSGSLKLYQKPFEPASTGLSLYEMRKYR
jgi:hypothetical protein